MRIKLVFIKVKSKCVGRFIEVSRKKVRQSLKEHGVIRFEILQERNDPSRFLFLEEYATLRDIVSHKKTHHYSEWRREVDGIMARPRRAVLFQRH